MGPETLKLGSNMPPAENEIKNPKEGLGANKNRLIAEFLQKGDYDNLLRMISYTYEKDPQKVCEVILSSMFDFHQKDRTDSVGSLIKTGLANLDIHGDAVKQLISYSYKNNLQGERFWKNPNKNETLYMDDEGELISFQGEIGTLAEGKNYIVSIGQYEVLTGPNKGKFFDGSYEAGQRNDPNYRPIKGLGAKK